MKVVTLDTAQTMALSRFGRLHDISRKRVRSFLRCVGHVNLQLLSKDRQRIDVDVGLSRTKDAIFGSYLHEWSLTKGKETKPPEQVYFWNSILSKEIEAEVDLYIRHLFFEQKKDGNNGGDDIPSLDYLGAGSPQAGVTVLFGGDHGDKNFPISCKLNLSPPILRKEKKNLGYHCPLITFANVQCSNDSFELMESTVMPIVKKQLNDLKKSSMLTVFHLKNIESFRSYIVPSTICQNTVHFAQTEELGTNHNVIR